MRVRRGGIVVGTGVVAAAVAVASAAWACTAWTGMYPLSQPAGPPGTEVTVRGTSPVAGPVEIRWDGLQGRLLGTAQAGPREQGGEFLADVTIPKAGPGVHYVVVVSSGNGGWSRASFKIPGKPGEAVTARPTLDPAQRPAPLLDADPLWSRPETSAEATSPVMAAGVALLSVGMVALVAVFGVAGARRRRATAAGAPEA